TKPSSRLESGVLDSASPAVRPPLASAAPINNPARVAAWRLDSLCVLVEGVSIGFIHFSEESPCSRLVSNQIAPGGLTISLLPLLESGWDALIASWMIQ